MNLSPFGLTPASLAAPLPAVRVEANASQLLAACRSAAADGARLVALWGSDEQDRGHGYVIRVLVHDDDGLTLFEHPLPPGEPRFPDLSPIFPAAARMQRAVFDLLGVASDADDQRPWLWMASWPIDRFPLRRDFDAAKGWEPGQEDYPFVRVEGDGVHEIPVGPVHAGIIEPGHFRFQIVGEKVLRLEERLGYVHKGVEKRFEALPLAEAHRLAGRICGDSTVAYAWAYAQACEGALHVSVPPRAAWLRALALERERIANHLGDLGYLGNDAGFGFGLAQFSRMKEDVLRRNARAFGHRMAMDFVVPGGVAHDVVPDELAGIDAEAEALAREVRGVREIYDEHAGVQDRFRTTGRVTPALAAQLGLVGLAGRASGRAFDLRADCPAAPYDTLDVAKIVHEEGDVAARVAVRFDELLESIRLTRAIVAAVPSLPDACRAALPAAPPSGRVALGYVEGWRGPVLVALETGPDGSIRRLHPHDPSWSNWPVLEHAVIGNIVPDFPLINKSFNLAYSGHDL